MPVASPLITTELIESALTYPQYVALATSLLAQGRTTSDSPAYNTPEILGYAKLNLHRMERLNKLVAINDELNEVLALVKERWTWLILTESWCGDAAQSVPVLNQLAGASPNVRVRLLLRDKHPELMNDYLTNGGRSIPKLICVREARLTRPAYHEVGTWGPRPADLQTLMTAWQSEKLPFTEVVERAQRWYNTDRTQSIQREMTALIKHWLTI